MRHRPAGVRPAVWRPPSGSDGRLAPDLLSETWTPGRRTGRRQWPAIRSCARRSARRPALARVTRSGRRPRPARRPAARHRARPACRPEVGRYTRPRALACARDGRIAVARFRDVEIWDGRTGERLAVLPDHGSFVTALDFDADGRGLASGTIDGQVRVWNLTTGEIRHHWNFGATGVTVVRFDPDGFRLTAALHIIAWDAETCRSGPRATPPASRPIRRSARRPATRLHPDERGRWTTRSTVGLTTGQPSGR